MYNRTPQKPVAISKAPVMIKIVIVSSCVFVSVYP
jgi:hypothetical protein